jgi:hypothetical protein
VLHSSAYPPTGESELRCRDQPEPGSPLERVREGSGSREPGLRGWHDPCGTPESKSKRWDSIPSVEIC